jgi:hypothetical protein
MSKEQLAQPQLLVTKFDTTERLRPGWPHHFHYEVHDRALNETAGFLVVRHWLESKQVDVDDLELHYPETAHQIGVHVLRACARDLRLQAIPELRFAEPMQHEIVATREAFGADALQIAHYIGEDERDAERRPYPQTLDELIAQTPQEFAPAAEANRFDMWIDLRAQDMTDWPTIEVHPEPVYL